MTIRQYSSFKSSGVPWLGDVPAHWNVVRLKFVAHVQTGIAKGKDNTGQETIEVPYLRVANVQDGYIDLDDVASIEIAQDDLARYRLQPGDVLMNEGGDFDKLGRGHVWDGSIDPCIHQNHVFAVRPFGLSPEWLNLFTGSAQAQFYFMSRSKQSTNLASISSTNVMELPVVVPPPDERACISAFLGRETAKIDALIDEQKRLVKLLKEELQCLVLASRSAEGTSLLRFGHAADVVARPVVQKEGELYRPLGMYNRGRGIFHKEAREMVHMGDSDFFWVRSGDLVISGQFAWEGAVGLAGEEEDGCVVSHRYPVLRAKDGIALTEYLFALLLTKHGDFVLNESSWGAAGRNRPLNLGLLLKEWIWVPSMQTQMKVAHAVHQSKRLADEIEVQLDLLNERRSALISAAVTGKIDVRGLVPQPEKAVA